MDTTEVTPTGTRRCVKCGAENLSDAPHCWSCNTHDWREDDELFEPPYPIGRQLLRDAMILLGLVACGFVSLLWSPISAVILLFIATPTFLITEAQALYCRRWDAPFSRRDRMRIVFKCVLVLTPLVLFATLATLLLYPLTPNAAYWFFWPFLPRGFAA